MHCTNPLGARRPAPPSDCDKHTGINKFGSPKKREQRKRPNFDCHCSVCFSGGRVLLSSHSRQVHCPTRTPAPRSVASAASRRALSSDRCVTCASCELAPEALTRHEQDRLPATATHASAPGRPPVLVRTCSPARRRARAPSPET